MLAKWLEGIALTKIAHDKMKIIRNDASPRLTMAAIYVTLNSQSLPKPFSSKVKSLTEKKSNI